MRGRSAGRSASLYAASLSGCALLLSPALRAEPEYPAVVQEAAGLTCAPSCRLCHTRDSGGLSFITPFGQRIWELGIRPGRPETVASTIRCMRERNCESAPGEVFDTDADGVSDIDELDRGSNPGRAGDSDLCGARYGCGARIEDRSELGWRAGAALGLGLVTLSWFRRRRLEMRRQPGPRT
ncbi:MAG TPA: hypothetical protein VK524_32655 [Polyangiaceae bacterium]|nr:hypothetical protein [Polyangiaceae bacterium]